MDVNFLNEVINTLGLPVAGIAALGWYINKKDKEKAAVDAEIRERNKRKAVVLYAEQEASVL